MTDEINVNNVSAAFVWGATIPPENLLDPNLVRPGTSEDPAFAITLQTPLAEYMTTGPGRFAFGNQFSIVQNFFFQNESSLQSPGGYSSALAPGKYKKSDLLALWGPNQANAIASFNQVLYRDANESNEQYIERAFVWGTTGFYLGDDAEFVVYPDGTREIVNYRVLPFNMPPNSPQNASLNAGKGAPDKFKIGDTHHFRALIGVFAFCSCLDRWVVHTVTHAA